MLDTLWQIFLGSVIVLAIALVWVVIAGIAISSVKQARKKSAALVTKLTVKNIGNGSLLLLNVRNVTTGMEKRVDFELQPGNSKTLDLSV